MQLGDRADVERLMERMARGDASAAFEMCMHPRVGLVLAKVVRSELARVGVAHPDHDDVLGLVVDVAIELLSIAKAWDPGGGALPWVWGHHRVRRVVGAFVGQHASHLDEEHLAARADRDVAQGRLAAPAPVTADDDVDPVHVLSVLAEGDELVALLEEALAAACTAAQRRLLLEVRTQEALGDRAPAATVARLHGMRPDAVRQSVKRARDRLRAAVAADDRLAPLAATAILG